MISFNSIPKQKLLCIDTYRHCWGRQDREDAATARVGWVIKQGHRNADTYNMEQRRE